MLRSDCCCYWVTLALIQGNCLISDFRHRPSYTNQLGHLTYMLGICQVGANANVLTIHADLSQRLSAKFVAVAGHDTAIGSSLIADLIHPVTRKLA